jgi:tRNA/rRNA methyltransferase
LNFHAYLLRCSDGSYYAGHTDDLDARVAQHQSGSISGYTEKRRPVQLVWSEQFSEPDQAFAAERQIKGWSRAKKEALIKGDWELVRAHARKPALRYAASPSSAATQDERVGGSGPDENPLILSSELSEDEGRVSKGPAIVLVRPQLGENIGKTARAMLNFGLTDLRLVRPRDGWPNPSAGPAASGADVVLERARVFESVAEAVADCPYVYASTVRKRELVLPVVTPEEAAREMRSQAGASAILFGAERSGLETEEAAIAGKILTVPINPEFRSLNLAQAVVLVAYEWSKHGNLAVPTLGEPQESRATHDQLEGLIGQMDQALADSGYYFPPDKVPSTRNTMRTILGKAGWSNREIQALRGMIRALVNPRRR